MFSPGIRPTAGNVQYRGWGFNWRSTWPGAFAEGDWNADGVFDQLDIVAAFQTGNSLQGPYAAQAVDPVFGRE